MNEENTLTKKEEKLITFKRNQFYTVLTLFAFAFGVLVGYFIWGTNSSVPVAPVEAAAQQPLGGGQAQAAGIENQAPTERYEIPIEGFPSEGPEDAPIVIVEFSDFECPFCTKWHNQVYAPLLEEYPDQIRLVYRNFPLTNIHANAFMASEAAMCAGDQDSYWDYHAKLFNGELGLTEKALKTYATELSLDEDTFSECLSSGKYSDFVQNDMDYAINLGVRSTPTFFINGVAVVGAQPLNVFQQIIDEELANN